MMAIDRGSPPEVLSQLLDMKDRIDATESRRAYVAAMTAFKSEPLRVRKTKKVAFGNTNYSHAELAELTDAAIAGLARHGLSHNWTVNQDNGKVSVSCVITHEMGHSESVTISAEPDSSGSKNKIQAIGSTITYLQRYTLMAITGLAAHDTDDDGRAAGRAAEVPAKRKGVVTQEDVDNLRTALSEYLDSDEAIDSWISVVVHRNPDEHRKAENWLEQEFENCRREFRRWNKEQLWPAK